MQFKIEQFKDFSNILNYLNDITSKIRKGNTQLNTQKS